MHQMDPIDDDAPESRRAARRGVELSCDVITQSTDEPLSGQIYDLSPYGMNLHTPVTIAEGEAVVLSFRPPRLKEEVTLFGRVRHTEDADKKGVEFEAVTKEEHMLLFDALRGIPPRLPAYACC